MPKVLAVASGGGHWVQLRRLSKAFEQHTTTWLTTNKEYSKEVNGDCFVVKDANLWNKPGLALMFLQVAWILIKVRPKVIITTGAAPGFAAIVLGRLLGAKTIWLDSIANAETLSTSGKKIRRWADVWLTQWEHLAKPDGPYYWGSVV